MLHCEQPDVRMRDKLSRRIELFSVGERLHRTAANMFSTVMLAMHSTPGTGAVGQYLLGFVDEI